MSLNPKKQEKRTQPKHQKPTRELTPEKVKAHLIRQKGHLRGYEIVSVEDMHGEIQIWVEGPKGRVEQDVIDKFKLMFPIGYRSGGGGYVGSGSWADLRAAVGFAVPKGCKMFPLVNWGNARQRQHLERKGWTQAGGWEWEKGEYRVTIYKDDEGWWHTDVWHNQWSVSIDATKSRSKSMKSAIREMLDDKVEKRF